MSDIITGTNTLRQTSASGSNYFLGTVSIGTTASGQRLTLGNDGGILATGTLSSGSALGVSGAGTRFIWYPRKGAIRAGTVSGAEWNDVNIGSNSTAFGRGNTAGGLCSVVAGGASNAALSVYAAIGGGLSNRAAGVYAVMAGGLANQTAGDYATVGGGVYNEAYGQQDTVAGGVMNRAEGGAAVIAGGWGNCADFLCGAVGGGHNNTAGNYATVAGGEYNTANGLWSCVLGGKTNTASGFFASVGGGWANTASGFYSTVPGGWQNSAAGGGSFAAGARAKANHQGAFVWGDGTAGDFASSSNNQFLIRAGGGVGIGTNSPKALLHVAGTARFQSGVTYIPPLGNLSMGTFTNMP